MKLLRKLRALFRRNHLEREMAEEICLHLELQTEKNLAAGMAPNDAYYASKRQFGGVEQIKEQVREQRGGLWLTECSQDLRYAIRTLRKAPSFTAVVVLTLALGVGLNTIVFSFYHLLVGKPLAVREPEQILRVSANDRRFQAPFTLDEVDDLRAGLRSASAVIASSPLQVVLAGGGTENDHQLPAAVQFVSGNFFAALGVPAVLGRSFAPDDEAVAVISYDAWQHRFNGARDIIGQTAKLHGVPVTIVGVAPESFGGTTPPSSADFWLPLALQSEVLPNVDWVHDRSARIWQVQVRREKGIAPEQVGAEVATIASTWRQPDGKPLRTKTELATFFQLGGPQVHAVCVTLLLAVGLILLVGCINILNLIHARNTSRSHEIAIRLALGASRGRLMRQLSTESLLLGLCGGAGGFVVAFWSCEAIRAWATMLIRRITHGTWSPFLDLAPDLTVFGYSLGLAIVAGLLTGLRPAWLSARIDVGDALKHRAGDSGAAGTRAGRNRLLAVQIAASLLLLAVTGLLLSGARRSLTADPGFDSRHLLTVVAWSNLNTTVSNRSDQIRRAREIEGRLRSVPGVIGVAGADRAPFTGHSITAYVTDDDKWVNGCVTMNVSQDYFTTLGLSLVAGRSFTVAETAAAAPVVIITESAARHLWPGRNPLGRQLEAPRGEKSSSPGARYTVVGVVQDARFTNLSNVDDVDLFFPQAATAVWLVRTQGKPDALVHSLSAELGTLDAKLPAQTAIWTLEEGSMQVQRLFAKVPADLALVLGGIALSLAAVGIYGMVSFLVVRRMQEIGIRLALGARPREVVALVLRQNLPAIGWGAGVGLAGAIGVSVLLTRLVLNAEMPDITYGAGTYPVVPYGTALAVLLIVLTLAAWLPARRAAKVDPMVALRCE